MQICILISVIVMNEQTSMHACMHTESMEMWLTADPSVLFF